MIVRLPTGTEARTCGMSRQRATPAQTVVGNCRNELQPSYVGGSAGLGRPSRMHAATAQLLCELACAGNAANKSYIRLHKLNTEYQERAVGKK